MSKTRVEKARAFEEWAERVESSDLTEADTEALRTIAELTERRDEVEEELTAAIRSARRAQRTWSEIGTMLGVSKQAAQRKYGSKVTA
jgi:C4-dicarboxylate-specific signal transduction histidine kinase